jgi:hypothetical protein
MSLTSSTLGASPSWRLNSAAQVRVLDQLNGFSTFEQMNAVTPPALRPWLTPPP